MTRSGDTLSRDSTTSLLTPVRPLGARHRLVLWIDGAERVAVLPEFGNAVVGRTGEADISVRATTVSRRHAKISVGPGAVAIVDLKSHNGTRVNGERLTSERLLSYGDVVMFGDVTALFEEDQVAEPRSSPNEGYRTLDLDGVLVIVEDPAMHHAYVQLERLA